MQFFKALSTRDSLGHTAAERLAERHLAFGPGYALEIRRGKQEKGKNFALLEIHFEARSGNHSQSAHYDIQDFTPGGLAKQLQTLAESAGLRFLRAHAKRSFVGEIDQDVQALQLRYLAFGVGYALEIRSAPSAGGYNYATLEIHFAGLHMGRASQSGLYTFRDFTAGQLSRKIARLTPEATTASLGILPARLPMMG